MYEESKFKSRIGRGWGVKGGRVGGGYQMKAMRTRVYLKASEMDMLKKNGAARLDPWEIFVLLALKIPFHFISFRKLPSILYVNCL